MTQHPVREFYDSELNRENEVLLTLRPGTTGKSGLRGVVALGYDADRRTLFVDNVHTPVHLVNGKLDLKIIVDKSSVEVFTADGVVWITTAVYPEPGTSREFIPFGL